MFEPSTYLPNAYDRWPVPAWRWLRAGYLHTHGREPCRFKDDPLTHHAWQFLAAAGRSAADDARDQATCRFLTVGEAYAIYSGGPPLRRAELEARLLAGQADETIAAKVLLSLDGVRCYHDLFYEVRPRLATPAYVYNVVLGGKVYHDIKADDHALILKLIGHAWGGVGVDAFLNYLAQPPVVPADFGDRDLASLKRLQTNLGFKLAVLSLTTPASALRPTAWVRLYQRFAAIRDAGDGRGSEAAASSGSIRAEVDVLADFMHDGTPDRKVYAGKGDADQRPAGLDPDAFGRFDRGVGPAFPWDERAAVPA